MCEDMSIGSLCGQLIIGGYVGEAPTETFLGAIGRGERAGAILFKRNLGSMQSAHEACRAIAQGAPEQTPVWICVDEEGGRVSRLPYPALKLPAMLKLGARGGALVERVAGVVGEQLRVLGLNLNLAPVLDVHTREENPVIGDRAFARDAQGASELGCSYVRGLQKAGIAACGKHFPGHRDTSVDSHLALPVVAHGLERLQTVELAPFREAIACGIDCVMSAHIVCEAVDRDRPATLSSKVISGLLRGELGFGGPVLSDDLEMKAIAKQWTVAEAAVQAITAGCDAVLICSREDLQQEAHAALVREAERSATFLARCQQAVGRTLCVRRACPPRPAGSVEQVIDVMRSERAIRINEELRDLLS